jgi:hypothetical protein
LCALSYSWVYGPREITAKHVKWQGVAIEARMAAQSTAVEKRFRPMVAVAAPVMAKIAAVVEVVAAVEAGPGLGPAPVPKT